MTEDEFNAWPKCAVPACTNKSCRRLGSKYCWPHTPVDPTSFASLAVGERFRFFAGGSLLTKSGSRSYDAPQFGQSGNTATDVEQTVIRVCRKCGGEMRPSTAVQETMTMGMPDFPGDTDADTRGRTMSHGGPGRFVRCNKCVACGWSVTL